MLKNEDKLPPQRRKELKEKIKQFLNKGDDEEVTKQDLESIFTMNHVIEKDFISHGGK